MDINSRTGVFLMVICLLLYSGFSNATIETYSKRFGLDGFIANFASDISVPVATSTLSFEGNPSGTNIRNFEEINGFQLYEHIPDVGFMVADDYDTTGGNNYLGLNDPGNFNQFIAGDVFDIYFRPNLLFPNRTTFGIGMDFITSDPLFDGDIKLRITTNSGYETRDISTANETILPDGGFAYWFGLTSSDEAFNQVRIDFDPLAVGTFLFGVDNITSVRSFTTPEPSTLLLMSIGLLFGFMGRFVSRKNSKRSA